MFLSKLKLPFLLVVFSLFSANQIKQGVNFLEPFQGSGSSLHITSLAIYSEEEIEFIDHQITQLLIDSDYNGNILISRYGFLIYERSFGFADFRDMTPLNQQTAFQLASISKTFTAASVLILQERGLLDIDKPVQKYIPEFPYSHISVRNLLNHTSGLQNYMWLVERRWGKSNKPNNEDILQLFLEHRRPLNFTPGTRFEYSNTGFVFLGLLIERVSGVSFKDFVHTNIFEPLEMEYSFVYDLHNPEEHTNRAYGFRQWRGRNILIPDDNLDGPLGDKGVFSSTEDLFKWDQAIYRNALLPSDAWNEAFEHVILSNDSTANYGLGWRLQNYIDKRIVHHPGRWHGFRTSLKRFVDDHTTLIMLSNNNMGLGSLIDSIQNILYAEEREIWLANELLKIELEELKKEEETGSLLKIPPIPIPDDWFSIPH